MSGSGISTMKQAITYPTWTNERMNSNQAAPTIGSRWVLVASKSASHASDQHAQYRREMTPMAHGIGRLLMLPVP